MFEGLLNELLADTNPGSAEVTSQPAYMEMQVALEGKAGSQMGDAVIPAQPPNFKTATDICIDLLGQSKHLSLMVSLARAAGGVYGFQGVGDSLNLMHKVVSAQWDEIYPPEDKDDPDDPWWERINLLRELTDSPKIADHLHKLEFVNVQHLGAFSKRDIDIAAGRIEGSEEDKERCKEGIIRGAFAESSEESLIATDQAMAGVVAACDCLDELFHSRIGSDAPSFVSLKRQVEECIEIFRDYAADKLVITEPEPVLPGVVTAEEGADVEQSSSSAGATAATVETMVVTVAFADRDSVVSAFDDVIRFYQQYEPSSPVPILLFRARQMVYKNFFDILRELAPQHKDNFRELMNTLRDDPLSFLLEHSYNSFLNGESFEVPADSRVDSPENPNPNEAVESKSPQTGADVNGGTITSRVQVVQTLKDIQKFFEIQEPSSPVPLIVRKVIAIVPKTFLDLLSEFEVADDNAQGSG